MEAQAITAALKRQAARGDSNAMALLRLRSGDDVAIRANRKALISAFGRCESGCSFWRCGRQVGHLGPCQP